MAVFMSPPVNAAENTGSRLNVLVVLSHGEDIYYAALTGIKEGLLLETDIVVSSVVATSKAGIASPEYQAAQADVIVPVGIDAARQVLGSRPKKPVYLTLVPSATYESLVKEFAAPSGSDNRTVSAIFVDQPYDRQLNLIKVALPGYKRIGVILGPTSRVVEKPLRQAAAGRQMVLNSEFVTSDKDLFRSLSSVLSDSELLLAVPDPEVFNRYTAQNLLLETYRQRKPVIGYSAAYVNAGALIGVYSTPRQIGRQLADGLIQMRRADSRKLPPPAYPKFFTIEVNRRVAGALGINTGKEEELQGRLEALEGRP